VGSLLAPATTHAQELRKSYGPPTLGLPQPQAAADAAGKLADWFTLPTTGPTLPGPPYIARGQDIGQGYSVPPVDFVGPLSHPRYEDGGFFTAAEFMYYRQSRPILSQSIAVRGFVDINGGVTGSPGTFVG